MKPQYYPEFFNLTKAQERVLKKVSNEPQTKEEIGCSFATLNALVKKRYIKSRQVMTYESKPVFWR